MLSSFWRGGENTVKKMVLKLSNLFYGLALVTATTAVNATCYRRFYQEELDDTLKALRKFD